MRIAQVAPLSESVPPRLYGGTERVVSVLCEELVRRGHQVTLFASADSGTAAELVPCAERGFRLDSEPRDETVHTLIELGRVLEREGDFDVIHSHVGHLGLPFGRLCRRPLVTTTHGRMDEPDTRTIFGFYSEQPLVSISNDQRSPLPEARWLATVYNAIDVDAFELHARRGDYLAFLGRIAPEKRADRAIEVARALDMPLKIAAKVDDADREYFEHAIKPFLDSSRVEFVGEVNEGQKDEFLGNAFAYLFPIDWPEPFGLTMVEAMACGTPVVAMDAGSVPEVVEDGVSGFVCRSLREFIDSVPRAGELDRAACREYARRRFSPCNMADGYEAVYERLIGVQAAP